jgi:hypothetical protein
MGAHVASASADYLCVPNISIPGCPAGASNEATISDAANNGYPGDTILIGAGTYVGSVGEAMNIVSPTSTVSNLGIEVYPTGGNTAIPRNSAGTGRPVSVNFTIAR